jgi:hypothetical protein
LARIPSARGAPIVGLDEDPSMMSPHSVAGRVARYLLAALLLGSAGALLAASCADSGDSAPEPAPSSSSGLGGSGPGGAGGNGGASGGHGGEAGSELPLPFGALEVLADGQDHPARIEVDEEGIYWTRPAHDQDGAVMTMAKEDGEPSSLVTAVDGDVTALALGGSTLYFASASADEGTSTISSVAVTGGASTEIATASGWAGDLAVGSAMVYWSYVGQGSGILQAPLAGGAAESLYHEGSRVTFLWLDETSIFFADTGTGPQTGAIGEVRVASGYATLITDQLARPYHLVGNEEFLYAATAGDGRVRRITKSGDSVSTLVSGQAEPYGVALDETGVYWTNRAAEAATGECTGANGSVGAWLFDRAGSVELASGLACPMGIAVDESGIYWVNYGSEEDHESGSVMWIPRL